MEALSELKLRNFRGRRSSQWVLYCVYVWTQEERWNDGAGKFLSTCPTARIWNLRTFISSPTWKKHLRAKRFKSHDDVKPEVQT